MNKTLTLLLAAASCAAITAPPPSAQDVARAAATISSADLVERIRVISSDDFEGRAPGTHGEKVTLEYLVREFKAIGLAPGNPDGTYLQKVPLSEFRSQPSARVRLPQGREIAWKQPEDFIAFSYERKPRVKIEDSPLVFVGYGVVAPEYRWDDFKGMDLRGKTLVVLVNDPQVPDPRDPSKLDESMFKGKAMTYYGRWTYKYEMGVKLGAAAVIIVHETIPASYPYEVVANSWGRENFEIRSAASEEFPPVAGWMKLETAKALFAATGHDLETLRRAALKRDFKPVVLGPAISFDVANSWREVDSYNVVARIEGADPKRRGEAIVHTAHWDHFGWDEKLPGAKTDQVYHGAIDNASGVAALLVLARAYRSLPRAPSRSVLFICTTGEERGLLGARYYVKNPLYPLERTLAEINIDGMNPWGRTTDMTISGMGHSSLDEIATRIAATQGRRTHPEARPEQGGFFRSDHLPFVRAGVPAANMGGGTEFIGKPPTFYREMSDAFTSERYHKVRDTLQPDYDFSGAIEDLRLLFTLGNEVAETDVYPSWKPGSEFHR
jgi:Zn-dependent M28 family amino/carboxypeptidase